MLDRSAVVPYVALEVFCFLLGGRVWGSLKKLVMGAWSLAPDRRSPVRRIADS